MRIRVTIRGEDPRTELRGYSDDQDFVDAVANIADDLGLITVVSIADDDYDPFPQQVTDRDAGWPVLGS
jgi:hypothetical protein